LIRALIVAFVVLPATFLRADEAPLPDLETMERLRLGEIVSEPTQMEGNGGGFTATLMMWTPVEKIWATVYSCENAFIFVEGLEVCEVLEENERFTVTHQIVNKGWPVPKQDYSFQTERSPYTRADIQLVEGNLKMMQASWEYINMPEAVVVRYQLQIELGFPAPRFMVRRSLNKGMKRLLTCIRALSGGSGSREREQEELDRCPGDIHGVP
jgi:hypothetical protein